MAPTKPGRKLSHDDYQICWLCTLDIEKAAAVAMLDDRHLDTNIYTLGRIGRHNVAISSGSNGDLVSAVKAAQTMKRAFKNMRVLLLVGVGSGVPGGEKDIRLGDIVVSYVEGSYGGVVQVDSGKTVPKSVNGNGFVHSGSLNRPPNFFLNVARAIQTQHLSLSREQTPAFVDFLSTALQTKQYLKIHNPRVVGDQLFNSNYNHKLGESTCNHCDSKQLVNRRPRGDDNPRVHLGLVASANSVCRDGRTRERLRREFNILCLETEAAGLMNNFPCFVVRGISDYADSHANDRLKPFAALAAAAYTKEWLLTLPDLIA